MAMSPLYDEIIMDHIRHARHYRRLDAPSARGDALNAMCGDRLELELLLEGGVLREVGFQCECCGVAMASASMMCEQICGKTAAEALAARDAFIDRVQRGGLEPPEGGSPDQRAVLHLLRASPSRRGCALLGWSALAAALQVAPGEPPADLAPQHPGS
jgi:SUF system NifU family Fe-S assembly protein